MSQQPSCSPWDQSPPPPGPQDSVAVWLLDSGLIFSSVLIPYLYLFIPRLNPFLLCPKQCSASCGKGTRMRYVSCRDNQGGVADESACAHLPKPPAREMCSVVACGQWKVLEWTAVREPPPDGLNLPQNQKETSFKQGNMKFHPFKLWHRFFWFPKIELNINQSMSSSISICVTSGEEFPPILLLLHSENTFSRRVPSWSWWD